MLPAGAKVQRYLKLPRSYRARGLFLFAWASLVTSGILAKDATALDDSRTLTFFHTHTQESATVTFWRDGAYVADGLKQLNHFLRDWRVEQSSSMDPGLFDIIWEMHRAVGSRSPVHIISAYRSPQTNRALRSRSRAVSEHSQHMLGRAMDIRFPDVEAARVREAAMRLQHGGVGFYPGANFVHVDVGNVRAWPRMTREQLARLFPDGKTVHLPADGTPLPGYEQARAEIMSRGSGTSREGGPQRRSLLAGLFAKDNGTTESPVAALPDEALAYAPVPSRREMAAVNADAPNAWPEADLALLRVLFSNSPLIVSHGPRRVTPVTTRLLPVDADLGPWITQAAERRKSRADPEMDQALKELARAMGERAKSLGEQYTSTTRSSIATPRFTP